MNKQEYSERSRKEKLPYRCPIIGTCERYALTIYYLSEIDLYGKGKTMVEKLRSYGYLSDKYEKEKIHQVGEPLEFGKSDNLCMFSNACPEVSLFDNGTIFGFIPEKAIVGGTWDNLWEENKFGDDNKFNIYNVGHYCECPEFGQYHYENKIVRAKRKTSRRRAPISTKLRFEIFQRDNFTCQYCKRNKDEDGVKLEIDHIVPVEMGGKDEISNLTTSCRECNNGKSNKVI